MTSEPGISTKRSPAAAPDRRSSRTLRRRTERREAASIRYLPVPGAGEDRRSGFTLLEILVVVVIAGLVAGVAMVGLGRAMKGAQIRTAARTLTMAHKFARNTAVLRQTPMALLLDSATKQVEVVSMAGTRSLEGREGFLEGREMRAEQELLGTGETNAAASADIRSEFVRLIGEDVSVQSFTTADADAAGGIKGIYWVNYHPNGMSDGFEAVLADPSGRSVTIVADPISGSAEARFSR